jgi:beta-glucanase (GH16 family)
MPTPTDPVFPYTTGYVLTEGRFAQTYGKIEFRMRGQYAPGLWYAVWGRPWIHQVPEFDVELLAENVNQVWFVNHWDVPPLPADDRRAFVTVEGLDVTEFHTYAITWTKDLVEWRIDDKPYMRATGKGVAHEPLFWTINAWVGGWAGAPSTSTSFPAGFEVDYFRIYRPREWPSDPAIRVATSQKDYYLADTLDVHLADFDRGARVEVWEGGRLRDTIAGPPFRFPLAGLTRAQHDLTFVGTDGARRASTDFSVLVQ